MLTVDGNKKVTLEELKLVHDLKLDKDFSEMTALPQSPADTDLLAIQNGSMTYKVPMSAISPSPLVVTITSGQWSGSGSDYYITVNASNVTANSILVPNYDSSSAAYLNGPVWCVPAAGSFMIHTSSIPSGTVNILVQFPGVMGEANYQVLADVYSTSQTYSKSEAVAKADIVNNLTSDSTDKPLSAAQGKALKALTGVTGVKGNSESSYRTGNVNITPANIGLGNVANYDQSKAIKSITRSGTTFTYTALDGTTGTFTQQDNNTTYSAGTGLGLSGTTFSESVGNFTFTPNSSILGSGGYDGVRVGRTYILSLNYLFSGSPQSGWKSLGTISLSCPSTFSGVVSTGSVGVALEIKVSGNQVSVWNSPGAGNDCFGQIVFYA